MPCDVAQIVVTHWKKNDWYFALDSDLVWCHHLSLYDRNETISNNYLKRE